VSLYTDAVLGDRPTSYWRLNELFGTVARDSSGNGKDLALHGGVSLGAAGALTSDADPGMLLNGTTGYLELPWDSALNGPGAFAYECWRTFAAYPAGTATFASSRHNAASQGWILLLTSAGAINFRLGNGAAFVSCISPAGNALNVAHHIVAVYDGTNAWLFIDNALAAGPVAVVLAPNPDNAFRIGQSDAGGFFAGTVDEDAYYGYALTAAQVSAHFVASGGPAVTTTPAAPAVGSQSVAQLVKNPGAVGGVSTAQAAFTASRYTFLFADLITNAIVGEFALSNVSFGRVLNGAGSFYGTLKISDPKIAKANPLGSTQPGRTALYIDRDGVLVWGGIIWTRRYQASVQALALGGLEFWSYFARRRIRDTLAFAATDQLAIAQAIINNLQGKPGGNIGVVVGSEVSGVLRDQTYNSWELKPGATSIEQLAALQNGFDFSIDVAYAGGVPSKQLVLGYPRRGATANQTGVFFELPGNVIDYDYPEDASGEADTMYAIGAGQGSSMLLSTAGRPDLIAAGYPLLEDVSSYTDVVIQATLDAHALADVGAKAGPIVLPEVTVAASIDPVLGSYSTGDDGRLRVTDPRFNLGWDPVAKAWLGPGLDTFYRVIGYDVTIPETGYETVRVRLGPTG
jgi:hypothetical protein